MSGQIIFKNSGKKNTDNTVIVFLHNLFINKKKDKLHLFFFCFVRIRFWNKRNLWKTVHQLLTKDYFPHGENKEVSIALIYQKSYIENQTIFAEA